MEKINENTSKEEIWEIIHRDLFIPLTMFFDISRRQGPHPSAVASLTARALFLLYEPEAEKLEYALCFIQNTRNLSRKDSWVLCRDAVEASATHRYPSQAYAEALRIEEELNALFS